MNLIALNLLFCLIAMLGSSINQATPQSKVQGNIPEDTVITLERTVCFGTCPSYKLTISANGTVVFEGHEYVKMKGVAKGRISRNKLRQLISEFERINYFSLRDTYQDSSDGCPNFATDMPSANTSLQINGRKKAISHYLGCWERNGHFNIYPRELVNLENKIDKIVGAERWIK